MASLSSAVKGQREMGAHNLLSSFHFTNTMSLFLLLIFGFHHRPSLPRFFHPLCWLGRAQSWLGDYSVSVRLFPYWVKATDIVLKVTGSGSQVCSRGCVYLFHLQAAPGGPVLSPWEPRTRCLWPQHSQRQSMPSSKGLIPTSRYT